MYNLIVTAQEDAWTGAPYELEKARVLSAGEYTDEGISKRLGTLDTAACAELQALPTLFAYETQNKKDARLGIIKRIRSRYDEVRIEYEILPNLPAIPYADVLRLKWEFHVTEWEMNRTNWTVKNVDLLAELQQAGILTSKQAKTYQAKLGAVPTPPAPADAGDPLLKENVVVSYSHKDKKFLDELLTHIKPLQRDGRVSVWSDKQIKPGSEWAVKIDRAFAGAKVALLLVTKDFLASDFIHERELGPLLKRAKDEGVVILWVLVRDCNWKKMTLPPKTVPAKC